MATQIFKKLASKNSIAKSENDAKSSLSNITSRTSPLKQAEVFTRTPTSTQQHSTLPANDIPTTTKPAIDTTDQEKNTDHQLPHTDSTTLQCRQCISHAIHAALPFLTLVQRNKLASRFTGTGVELYALDKEEWCKVPGCYGLLVWWRIRRMRKVDAKGGQSKKEKGKGEMEAQKYGGRYSGIYGEEWAWEGLYSIVEREEERMVVHLRPRV